MSLLSKQSKEVLAPIDDAVPVKRSLAPTGRRIDVCFTAALAADAGSGTCASALPPVPVAADAAEAPYLDHFALRELPFAGDPPGKFFFAGAKRRVTLDALSYAIVSDEGVVRLCGESGSGKTFLARELLERLADRADTIYLAQALRSRDELLTALLEALQVPVGASGSRSLLAALRQRLIEINDSGRQVIALFDDAHTLSTEVLEAILCLAHLQDKRNKLLKIVLFAQPELAHRLDEPALRPLRRRITYNFALEALGFRDVGAYLRYRLSVAGCERPEVFTAAASQLISDAAAGMPQRIDMLAAKSLLLTFRQGVSVVDLPQARAAINEIQAVETPETPLAAKSPARAGIACAALLAVAALAYLFVAPPGNDVVAEPTPAVTFTVTSPVAADAGAAAIASPEDAVVAAVPPGAGVPSLVPVVTAVAAPLAAPVPNGLDARIASSEEWLRRTPDSHYFLQLISTSADDRASAERMLEAALSQLDADQVHAYRSRLSGHEKLGVIYGDYPTAAAAERALAALPARIAGVRPYVRQVHKLR